MQTTSLTRLNGDHDLNSEKEKVGDQKDGCDRGLSADRVGHLLTEGGEGEVEVGAALVTAGSVDADKRAATGTDARTGLALSAAEEAAKFVFDLVEAPLPTIGKGQRSSLRRLRNGTYNTGIARFVSERP